MIEVLQLICQSIPRYLVIHKFTVSERKQAAGIKLCPDDPYTLYTSDIFAINLNTDLYGSHPFYMDLRNHNGTASAHGALLMNNNATDVCQGKLIGDFRSV